jgi:hypothetical protein
MSTTITLFYDSNCVKPITGSMIDITMENVYTVGNSNPVPITSDSTVEQTHCKFTSISNQTKYIENLSNFGTYFKLKKASTVEIPYKIYILIGNTWILPTKELNGTVTMVFVNEEYKESIPPVNVQLNSIYLIGKTCTEKPCITIDDAAISVNHLRLQFLHDSIKLTDYKNGNGSTNGTWVCFTGGIFIEGYLQLRIGAKTFLQVFKPVTKLSTVKGKLPFSFIPEYTKKGSSQDTIKIDSSYGIHNTVEIDSSSSGAHPVWGMATSYYHPLFTEVQKLNLTSDYELINIFLQMFSSKEIAAQKILVYKEFEQTGKFAILDELVTKYKNAKYVKCAYIAADKNIFAAEQFLQANPSFIPK